MLRDEHVSSREPRTQLACFLPREQAAPPPPLLSAGSLSLGAPRPETCLSTGAKQANSVLAHSAAAAAAATNGARDHRGRRSGWIGGRAGKRGRLIAGSPGRRAR